MTQWPVAVGGGSRGWCCYCQWCDHAGAGPNAEQWAGSARHWPHVRAHRQHVHAVHAQLQLCQQQWNVCTGVSWLHLHILRSSPSSQGALCAALVMVGSWIARCAGEDREGGHAVHTTAIEQDARGRVEGRTGAIGRPLTIHPALAWVKCTDLRNTPSVRLGLHPLLPAPCWPRTACTWCLRSASAAC